MAIPSGLLETTFDQLRTLLMVAENGSALSASRVLGREQSSVQKQLDTLNRGFQEICGERLVNKQGRGQPFRFTPTGQRLVELARTTLDAWQGAVDESRRRLGHTVTVGTTEFTLDLLSRVWNRVSDDFQAREIELKVLHVRTKDAFARLGAKDIDLMCGGFTSSADGAAVFDDYEFLEWRRDRLMLLTNLPRRELPMPEVGIDRLPSVPLVVPASGVITDFLKRCYGMEFRNRLMIAATIDDIYYGLALLRSGMADGCMIVSGGIGKAAVEGRLPGSPDFRLVSLAADFDPMPQLVTGVFGRKGEREQYEPAHPLNALWRAFGEEIESGGIV